MILHEDTIEFVRSMNADMEIDRQSVFEPYAIVLRKHSTVLDQDFCISRIIDSSIKKMEDPRYYMDLLVRAMMRKLIETISNAERRVIAAGYMDHDEEAIMNTYERARKAFNEYANRTKGDTNEMLFARDTMNFTPKKVVFNPPATIVIWQDGTKTVVRKQSDYEPWDPEKAIALCFMKKFFGNTGKYNDILKKYTKEDEAVSEYDEDASAHLESIRERYKSLENTFASLGNLFR